MTIFFRIRHKPTGLYWRDNFKPLNGTGRIFSKQHYALSAWKTATVMHREEYELVRYETREIETIRLK